MAARRTAWYCCCYYATVLTALAACKRACASPPPHQPKHQKLQVYLHDDFNVTDFLVTPGVAAGNANPLTGSPFGATVCFNDPVTEGPLRNSTPLGSLSGTNVGVSFDGSTSFTTSTLSLHIDGGYHGSVSFMGVSSVLQPTPLAVVGGTGSFLFAQGSAIAIPIEISNLNQTFRLDLDLYWPPYLLA